MGLKTPPVLSKNRQCYKTEISYLQSCVLSRINLYKNAYYARIKIYLAKHGKHHYILRQAMESIPARREGWRKKAIGIFA